MDDFSLDNQAAMGLTDFWRRRALAPRHRRERLFFGRRLRVDANDPALLTAVDHAAAAYSRFPDRELPPLQLQLAAQPFAAAPGPPPADLMQRITYSGADNWLLIHLAAWGHAFVDLEAGRGTAVVDTELAARPDLLSQCLLHTILLNFIIATGFGYLHASCLLRERGMESQLILLLGGHNVGKSTTALQLATAGWRLLTDSMVFVTPGEPLQIGGFPVGTMKLRADVLDRFPHCAPYVTPEVVRAETKYRLDCRAAPGVAVVETAVPLQRAVLFLLERGDAPQTETRPADPAAVATAVRAHSLYIDRPSVWARNVDRLEKLLRLSTSWHLRLGSDPAGLLAAVDARME